MFERMQNSHFVFLRSFLLSHRFYIILKNIEVISRNMDQRTNNKELRYDRHTVSLLTDHMVFAPKYRGKRLVDDVAMIVEGIICKTCKELDIEIIEIAVNPDHVHIFFKYPPMYSLSFIARRLKGRTSQILRKEFPHLKEWCGEHIWAPSCYHGSVGNGWDVVSKYIETQDVHHATNDSYRPYT